MMGACKVCGTEPGIQAAVERLSRNEKLARVSQTIAGVTEANLVTGQERREERIGYTVERLDAACHQIRAGLLTR